MPYDIRTVTVKAGVAPNTDFTPQSTEHYAFTDKVRMVNGFPEKIGGWQLLQLSGNYDIQGTPRNIFSYILSNTIYYLVASYKGVWAINVNTLYNATPVEDTATTYNNILGTYYGTLDPDPYFVQEGVLEVVVSDPGHPFMEGDILTFSGATTFAGLGSGDLNGTFSIGDVTTDSYSFGISTIPTSTEVGGGASIIRASRIVSVTQTQAYGEGDNVLISNVQSPVGGILESEIEGVRTVRSVTASGYNIVIDGVSTSSVSAAGGDVDIQGEIPDGQENSTVGYGYGMGLYGAGLYGVGKASSNPTPPTIWSFDRFGDLVIMTPGNQTGLYSWATSFNTLPELVANAPTEINYAFVTDNIAVTLGADNVPNRIKWSDQGSLTVWAPSTTNQAGEDDIEGAGEFISHAQLRGFNLLFTPSAVYSFRYIGKPFVFETKLVDASRGLIARNARIVVDGVAYWMGSGNFHMYRGGNVEIIPSNGFTQSSMKNYVYSNINQSQSDKIYCWYDKEFNEIWWHYPRGDSTECNAVVRLNVLDFTWVPDTSTRTAAEYPTPLQITPYLAGFRTVEVGGSFDDSFDEGFDIGVNTEEIASVYKHESGYDDDGVALAWRCDTNYATTGSMDTIDLGGVYQDNTITNGDISLTINTKLYPNQEPSTVTYPITIDNQNLIFRRHCRYWQYSISGNELGQFWRGGAWQELFKKSSKR